MSREETRAAFLETAMSDVGAFLEAAGHPPLTPEQAHTLGDKIVHECEALALANPELAPGDLGFLARALAFDLLAAMLFSRRRSGEEALRLGIELCAVAARHANARIVAPHYREFTPAQRNQLVRAVARKAHTLASSGMDADGCTEAILRFVDVAIGLVLGAPEAGFLVN